MTVLNDLEHSLTGGIPLNKVGIFELSSKDGERYYWIVYHDTPSLFFKREQFNQWLKEGAPLHRGVRRLSERNKKLLENAEWEQWELDGSFSSRKGLLQ